MRWLATRRRAVGAALAILVAAGGAAACSSSDDNSGSGAGSATYTIWDPYPQFDDGSDWVKLLNKCGTDAGVTRQAHRLRHHRPDQQGAAGRAAGQLAGRADRRQPGGLHPRRGRRARPPPSDTKLDTSAISPNLLGAGQSGGKTYGVPIGANTLALYYNKAVLTAAGVDPPRSRTGPSLTAALAKVKAAGKKGITFSAIGTEEGSFQFLPWFWGSGAQPDHSSTRRRPSRRCRCGPTGSKKGYAPELGHQQHPDHQLAGVRHRRLRVRRERHLAAGQRQEGRLRVRHHPDPGQGRRHRAGADRRRVRHHPGAEGHRPLRHHRRSWSPA